MNNEMLEAWSSRVRIHLHLLSSGLEQVTLSLVISDSEITCEVSVRCKMSLLTKYYTFLSYPSNMHLACNYDIYVRERKDIGS